MVRLHLEIPVMAFCNYTLKNKYLGVYWNQSVDPSICLSAYVHNTCIPFRNDKFQTLPKLKDFADNNFKFDENGTKFSKRVENTVGKGGIACYEQFLPYPQCLQKTCTADTWGGVLVISCGKLLRLCCYYRDTSVIHLLCTEVM